MENLQELISNPETQNKTRIKKINFKMNDETKQQIKLSKLSILEEDEDFQQHIKEEYLIKIYIYIYITQYNIVKMILIMKWMMKVLIKRKELEGQQLNLQKKHDLGE
jgi:hypothetical protein